MFSSSLIENYEKQIDQLQQNLTQKDNERTSLLERLNEIELELKTVMNDQTSMVAQHETLTKEK